MANNDDTENTYEIILKENEILKGKLRGFKTLDKMFKDVKEKNKELENEIQLIKENSLQDMEAVLETGDFNTSDLNTIIKEAETNKTEHEYKLPSPKITLENMSVSEELRIILDQNPNSFGDKTKLTEELKKLSHSIFEIEAKRQRDKEVIRILSKELKKCKSERELLKRENEQFIIRLQIRGGDRENWILLDNDSLESTSDEWRKMYFAVREKSDKDLSDLRKHMEVKNREISRLYNILEKEKSRFANEIAVFVEEYSSKSESASPVKSEEQDMIKQQLQIFQEDFKVEHEERMKAQAAKLEIERKLDTLMKEFEQKSNLLIENEKKLKYIIAQCETLKSEKVLIKNELGLAQQNLNRASEFMTNLSAPQKKYHEATENSQRYFARQSALALKPTKDKELRNYCQENIAFSTLINEEVNLKEITTWKCPSCTLQNKAWAYNCSVCKTRKPDSDQFPLVCFDEIDSPPTFDSLEYFTLSENEKKHPAHTVNGVVFKKGIQP